MYKHSSVQEPRRPGRRMPHAAAGACTVARTEHACHAPRHVLQVLGGVGACESTVRCGSKPSASAAMAPPHAWYKSWSSESRAVQLDSIWGRAVQANGCSGTALGKPMLGQCCTAPGAWCCRCLGHTPGNQLPALAVTLQPLVAFPRKPVERTGARTARKLLVSMVAAIADCRCGPEEQHADTQASGDEPNPQSAISPLALEGLGCSPACFVRMRLFAVH